MIGYERLKISIVRNGICSKKITFSHINYYDITDVMVTRDVFFLGGRKEPGRLGTKKFDLQWFSFLITVLFLHLIITSRVLMADSPKFSIVNSFEREDEHIPRGGWSTTDTYTQEYKIDWGEKYSSRLEVDLGFELKIEDIIRSLDVDEKSVEPSLELDVSSRVWTLNLLAEDTIEYSNEFNTPRSDSIEYGATLSLVLNKFPSLTFDVQRLVDYQKNLEDKVLDQYSVGTGYDFYGLFDFSANWVESTTDDMFFLDRDLDKREWEFKLDYSGTWTPVFKIDYQLNWSGMREDTLNDLGVILNMDREKDLENKLKVTLDTFPQFKSTLEVISDRNFADEEDENSVNLLVENDMPVVGMGDFSQTLEIDKELKSFPTEKTDTDTIDLSLKMEGSPWRFTDYSMEYVLGLTYVDDQLNVGNDSITHSDAINLSFTLTPEERVLFQTAYSWSIERITGEPASDSQVLTLEAVVEGSLFHVPNLEFNPLLEISSERTITTGEREDVINLELDFFYTVVTPPSSFWSLNPIYTYEREDEDETTKIDFTSDFLIEFVLPTWSVEFEQKATLEYKMEPETESEWEHEYTLNVERELTATIDLEMEYEYEHDTGGPNSDSLTVELGWRFAAPSLQFSYSRERIFEGEDEILSVFLVDFSMDF